LSGLFIGLIPIAVYLYSLGRRTIQADQFPPPGTRVLRKIDAVKGSPAITRGRMLQGFSILFAVFILIGLYLIDQLVKSFISSA